MERISWIERKTNEEVLSTVGEKGTLVGAIKVRRWKMAGHTLRHPEELHDIILKCMIEGKKLQDVPEIVTQDKLNIMQG